MKKWFSARPGRPSLSPVLVAYFVGMVLALTAMVGIYGYVAVRNQQEDTYLAHVADMRLSAERLRYLADRAVEGDAEALRQLATQRNRFREALARMQEGSDRVTRQMESAVAGVSQAWGPVREAASTLLDSRQAVLAARSRADELDGLLAGLIEDLGRVAEARVAAGGPVDQVRVVGSEIQRAQRLRQLAGPFVNGGEVDPGDAGELRQGSVRLLEGVEGLVEGDPGRGILPASDVVGTELLEGMLADARRVSSGAEALADRTSILRNAFVARARVDRAGAELGRALEGLQANLDALGEERRLLSAGGDAAGLVAVLLLLAAGWRLRKEGQARIAAARAEQQQSEEQNRRNQEAILRLLDEMGDLADGDLTVNATVTEDITGAIADSVNYTVDALRSLVRAINETTEQVSASAQESQSRSREMAAASSREAEEVSAASEEIQRLSDSFQEVTDNAEQVAEQARASVDLAGTGGDAVRSTIQAMDSGREQIQETSKRIKRLGESSQEIGDIVELINDIAEQTNILALNAAIQAAAAGEQGRGFAVVADEVQQLAERSADATRQIEGLVKTIQADTAEAVSSMERSTSEVLRGAGLAQEAGDALTHIEQVSHQLSGLVEGISQSVNSHTRIANGLATRMGSVQESALETSRGTDETAEAIGLLAERVQYLRRSVSGFKLPEQEGAH
ncbi:twitching motility protein PilJ [Thiohalospira halophila DSM 15071]|uniref:Twitching motility protein PilJ n=1 Tax=Thiohalospira halophila DSM 15071 TaxID=1123397 RepID=A0A1I1SQR7_9GAMM|nr:methyl-accepting chemotaxis protein [Thiohalospira halophila]SFD45410.1 twitching motility protein PilJ [Thiohalospira halophila DSM 15071]